MLLAASFATTPVADDGVYLSLRVAEPPEARLAHWPAKLSSAARVVVDGTGEAYAYIEESPKAALTLNTAYRPALNNETTPDVLSCIDRKTAPARRKHP